MIVLAIESTGTTCGTTIASVELDSPMNLLATSEVFRPNIHDELLAATIQTALIHADLKIEDVDVVAISAGPGSFTGIRIGMSLAKGLTMTGVPALLVVDTLDALALASAEVAAASSKSSITCVVASHRDLYYAARYTVNGKTVAKDDRHPVEKLLDLASVTELADSSLVCGPSARAVDPSSISGLSRLSSRFVALEACRALSSGVTTFTDSMTAEPLYRQEMSIFAPTLPQSRKT